MERNTKQKMLVKEALFHLNHPTAQKIYDFIKKDYPHISLATIYRILAQFEEQNQLLHIKIPNTADCYDYQTHPHYHLTCKKCKNVYDIDIPYLSNLDIKTDEYSIEHHTILFNGICANCQKNKEGE